MSKTAILNADFERQKNTRAALYTGAITGALLLLIFLIKFYQPVPVIPQQEEYIEINLGSSDVGSGNDQPQLPGEPAPAQQEAYTPPQAVAQASNEAVRDVEESDEAEAPPVYKPANTKPGAKKINDETKVVKATQAATTPAPVAPAPRPRAVMPQVRGGNGSGGNGAETYRPGTGEGQGGGPGDQGSVGGNPNGRDYTPKRLSVRIDNFQSKNFQDDFDDGGVVILDIHVDANGKITNLVFQPKGSTITNRKQIEIAKRRAYELSFAKYPGGSIQPQKFVFEVKN